MVSNPDAERRKFRRRGFTGQVMLDIEGQRVGCKLLDISVGGVAVRTDDPPDTGADIVVEIDGLGRFDAYVRCVDGDRVGLAFATDTRERWLRLKELSKSLN
jgi:hypothetical protein